MSLMIPRRRFLATALGSILLAGCKKGESPAEVTAEGLTKVRVGYIGLTCEAPVFVAMENGYFKEEGLEVEPV